MNIWTNLKECDYFYFLLGLIVNTTLDLTSRKSELQYFRSAEDVLLSSSCFLIVNNYCIPVLKKQFHCVALGRNIPNFSNIMETKGESCRKLFSDLNILTLLLKPLFVFHEHFRYKSKADIFLHGFNQVFSGSCLCFHDVSSCRNQHINMFLSDTELN